MIPTSEYRTLIADDEQPARDHLKKLLAEYSIQIELISESKSFLLVLYGLDGF